MRRTLLFFVLGLSTIVFVLNAIALRLDLYYSVWWADIVVHTLGGVTMAAALTCLYENKYTAVRIVAFVLIIGVLWEVLEVTSGMTSIGDKGYILDTLDDLCFDMVGAYFMAVISPLFGPNFNLKLRSSRVK